MPTITPTGIPVSSRLAIQRNRAKDLAGLTADRLVVYGDDGELESVDTLSSFIGGTANRITVSDDGDGTITLSAPQNLHTGADVTFNTVLATSGIRTVIATDDVSDPPTDAELDSAFGTPSSLGSAFIGFLDDNDGGTDCYLCATTGTDDEWFYVALTKASTVAPTTGNPIGLLLTLTYA